MTAVGALLRQGQARSTLTIDSCVLQPGESRLLLLVHSLKVPRYVQLDLRLEGLGREPTISDVRFAHHYEWLPQSPRCRELEHAFS